MLAAVHKLQFHLQIWQQRSNAVVRLQDAGAHRAQRHRAIQRTGVHINIAQRLGCRLGDGGLACTGRSVNGNIDHHKKSPF